MSSSLESGAMQGEEAVLYDGKDTLYCGQEELLAAFRPKEKTATTSSILKWALREKPAIASEEVHIPSNRAVPRCYGGPVEKQHHPS
jgi:hypothetical protein